MKISIISNSPQQTEEMAAVIGRSLKGGEVIELVSDVGGGKTTFTRGMVNGIGSKDIVASPTFTISRFYKGKDIDIYHFDFYRLSSPGLMAHELSDAIANNNVVVVEWPELVENVLPGVKMTVSFQYSGDDKRKLTFTYPKILSYLISEYLNEQIC